jgi:hypothetical protein
VFASLHGDPATVAQSLYPDRPQAAASMGAQQLVMSMQCSGCHSIGIDGTRENFAGMPTLVKVETLPGVGGVGLDAVIAGARAEPDPVGMVAGEEGRLTSPVGEVAWLDFTVPGIEVSGRRYFVFVGEDLWWLTYMDPWNDPDRQTADRIALSFAPGATVAPPTPG